MGTMKENAKKLRNGVLGAAFVAVVASPFYFYNRGNDVCFTVTDKERVPTDVGVSEFRVTTEDSAGNIEVFKNVDSWLRFKFRSSDLQGLLKPGQHYEASVYGMRVGIFSMYRNISEAKVVESCPAPKP